MWYIVMEHLVFSRLQCYLDFTAKKVISETLHKVVLLTGSRAVSASRQVHEYGRFLVVWHHDV